MTRIKEPNIGSTQIFYESLCKKSNVKIHILESEGRLFKAHSDRSPSLRGRWELWESMPLPLSPEQSEGRLTSIF